MIERNERLAEANRLIAALNAELLALADLNTFIMLRVKSIEHTRRMTRPEVEMTYAQVHEVLIDTDKTP